MQPIKNDMSLKQCKAKMAKLVQKLVNPNTANDDTLVNMDAVVPCYLQRLEEIPVMKEPFLPINYGFTQQFDKDLYRQLACYPQEPPDDMPAGQTPHGSNPKIRNQLSVYKTYTRNDEHARNNERVRDKACVTIKTWGDPWGNLLKPCDSVLLPRPNFWTKSKLRISNPLALGLGEIVAYAHIHHVHSPALCQPMGSRVTSTHAAKHGCCPLPSDIAPRKPLSTGPP